MKRARELLGPPVLGALLACATPSVARAQAAREPLRVLLAVGSSRGAAGEAPLQHAADDATHVRDAFVEQGWVRRENAELVREPTRGAIDAAVERVRAIAAARRPQETLFVFYYSGHGAADALHLRDGPLPLVDLSLALARVPAAFRLIVTDACRTPAPMREKGAAAEPAFALSLAAPVEARGTVWLHATADGDVAQESDELGGALFTHHWVQGLRGAADANGDGRVTLDESYVYAYGQTLARSALGSGVYQRPTRRVDLSEAASVVLTHTQATGAELELPRGADAHYLVYGVGTHSIAAELFGAPDRSVTVAVPAGRYVVHLRGGRGGGAVELRLAQGEHRALAPSDFKPFSREELARKGGELLVSPHELTAAVGVAAPGYAGWSQGGSLRYAYRLGAWSLGAIAGGSTGGEVTRANEVAVRAVGLRARGARVIGLGAHGELVAGAGLVGEVVLETVRRLDAEVVERAGYAAERSFSATALGGEAFVAARAELGTSWVVGLEAGFVLTGASTGEAVQLFPRGEVVALGGVRF